MTEIIPEDLLQEIARSSYADMLNDDERNRAYDQAIRICVGSLVNLAEHNPSGDRFFKCCDIGTGSGLLSMMIVRAFQELKYWNFHVTAFESFKPMATCAQEVITRSGMSEFITIIPTSSDVIEDDPSFDLLVAELLDTELIGEGCLATYKHAVEHLCSPTCLFVPHEANIYIEPIASKLLFQRHAIDDINLQLKNGNRAKIKVSDEVVNCCGLAVIDDMQVSALKEGIDFERFSSPLLAFTITFNDRMSSLSLADYDNIELLFPIAKPVNQPVVVVMWWEINMYDSRYIITHIADDFPINLKFLSCAPTWARKAELLKRDKMIRDIYKRDVWREHWIQGVYYFSNVRKTRLLPTTLEIGETLSIHAYRDTYSLWFELEPSSSKLPPNCTCGVHRALSRSQVAFLNDTNQMRILVESHFAGLRERHQLYFGKITFEPRPNTKTIQVDDAPKWCIRWDQPGINAPQIYRYDLFDLSFSDEISWEKVMARSLDRIEKQPVQSFVIKFSQFYFENLNRIRSKVGKCEGFDLEPLDKLIGESSKIIDKAVESHHLWEYETKRLDTDYIVCSSSMIVTQEQEIREGKFLQRYVLPIKKCLYQFKQGWALVFWTEFNMLNTSEILSTGPIPSSTTDPNEAIKWNRHCNQLVYFLHDIELTPQEIKNNHISINVIMDGCYIDIKRPTETRPRVET